MAQNRTAVGAAKCIKLVDEYDGRCALTSLLEERSRTRVAPRLMNISTDSEPEIEKKAPTPPL